VACIFSLPPQHGKQPKWRSDGGVVAVLAFAPQLGKQPKWRTDDGVCAANAPTQNPASNSNSVPTIGFVPFYRTHNSQASNQSGVPMM